MVEAAINNAYENLPLPPPFLWGAIPLFLTRTIVK